MEEASQLEGTLDTLEYALINLVRHHPVIYNTHDPTYRDKFRKEAAWTEIARQLNKEEGWCYMKWQNLRDYYRKRKKIYESGTGGSKRWVYFDAMTFMDPFENIRDNVNCASISGIMSAISELSSSSSRSANDLGNENVHPAEDHSNYFDETQYHSLDGITERADVKVAHHFLDPLTDNCPPSKKQKTSVTSANSSMETVITQENLRPNNPAPEATQSDLSSHSSSSRSHNHNHTVTPSIVSVQSKAVPNPPHQSQSKNENVPSSIPKLVNTESNSDCPHYHFCMSLLTRMRKMDPGKAVCAQMKIMEVILKTEFPDEYEKQRENSNL